MLVYLLLLCWRKKSPTCSQYFLICSIFFPCVSSDILAETGGYFVYRHSLTSMKYFLMVFKLFLNNFATRFWLCCFILHKYLWYSSKPSLCLCSLLVCIYVLIFSCCLVSSVCPPISLLPSVKRALCPVTLSHLFIADFWHKLCSRKQIVLKSSLWIPAWMLW